MAALSAYFSFGHLETLVNYKDHFESAIAGVLSIKHFITEFKDGPIPFDAFIVGGRVPVLIDLIEIVVWVLADRI